MDYDDFNTALALAIKTTVTWIAHHTGQTYSDVDTTLILTAPLPKGYNCSMPRFQKICDDIEISLKSSTGRNVRVPSVLRLKLMSQTIADLIRELTKIIQKAKPTGISEFAVSLIQRTPNNFTTQRRASR